MKKLQLPQNYKLVLVDGFKIRNFLDIDFVIIDLHSEAYFSPKIYIPKGEVWLDYHYYNEQKFLLEVLFYSENLLYSPGQKVSTEKEKKESLKKKFCSSGPIPNFKLKKIKKNNLTIYLVDGKVVREHFDPEFILGGHEFVYSYIPKNEIWIDIKSDPAEFSYTLLHEATERSLMKAGKNYDVAHEYATVVDKEKRRLDKIASYPGDADYPFYGQTNKKLIKNFLFHKKYGKLNRQLKRNGKK